jgi:hypothetical protein
MAWKKMIPPKRAGELNESLSNLLVFDFFGFFLRLEKIPQPGEFNNMFRRQNRANQIRLRSRVDLIQMMLRCGLRHEPLYAFVECAVNYHIGTCAEGGAYAFSVD